MSQVSKLEQEVDLLTDAEYREFRRWFFEIDWNRWDRQLEIDVANGKLDFLVAEAAAGSRHGKLKSF